MPIMVQVDDNYRHSRTFILQTDTMDQIDIMTLSEGRLRDVLEVIRRDASLAQAAKEALEADAKIIRDTKEFQRKK
jgi:hypothetical protein